jgi:hypothetical protein
MINAETKTSRLFALTQLLDSMNLTIDFLRNNPDVEQGVLDWYDTQYNATVDVLVAYNSDNEPSFGELFAPLGMANRNKDKAVGKGWSDKIKLWGEVVAELEDWQQEIRETAPDISRYARR